MDEDKKKVVTTIRSLLISRPYAATIEDVESDYLKLMGKCIPYQQFGFKKVDEFLKSVDSVTLNRQNGKTVVTAKVIEKSAHIVDLVSKQKTDNRKLLRKNHRYTFSKAIPTTNWRPKQFRQNVSKYEQSPRLAAVAHNQFINRPSYDQPRVPSKVVIPESSALYSRQNTKKTDINSRLHMNATVNEVNIQPTDSVEREKPCSPLASTRKRILKKISEINLDRDSGNSSPTDESTQEIINEHSLKISKFVETGDPLTDLHNFVKHFKLEPIEMSTKPLKTKQNRFVISIIKVGKESYHSYPQEFDSAKAAEKYCAQIALQDLVTKYNKEDTLLIASPQDILRIIPSMLEKHTYGMWVHQLELDYADKYKEKLPSDWLKIIDSSPNIELEKNMDSYVIRYRKPGGAIANNLNNNFMAPSDVSVPSNTVQPEEGGKINAQITCVMSVNEIWCRQISTEESDVYHDMLVKMESFYNSNKDNLKAQNITVGGYYVALYEMVWFRIKAIEQYNSEIRCFFIDFGDEIKISKDNIYQLRREFALCQAQAFVCRLVGLEDLYEVSQNSEALQNILYKQVILELAETAEEDDLTLQVFMYSLDDGKSINQEMIALLALESAPAFCEKDSIADVYVSNIESNGDIYVQQRSQGYKALQKLLFDLETQILENPGLDLPKPTRATNIENKIYLVKDKIDKHFHRVQIIDWAPEKCGPLVQIYFVDIGKCQVINVEKEVLYPLDSLSDIVQHYPYQAYKVKIVVDEIPEDFVSITNKLMPLEQMVLMKIIDYKENIPMAEFFKRNTDGTLFCINKSIAMEIELKTNKIFGSSTSSLKKSFEDNQNKNVPSSGKLAPPDLPTVGNYFGVYVPLAVNPYNFFIQPLTSNSLLYGMMEKLQNRYKNLQYSPLQIDQIIPGNIYVSQHEDGIWYRTSVIKVIHSGSVSVFLCDFGYYTNLTIQQIFPLDSEFMELPYQAVKAKLAAIKPKFTKWTVNDCESFKFLVEGKQFYSKLEAVEPDELYKSDMLLSLTLIDTSGTEDVFITNELINREIAVEIK